MTGKAEELELGFDPDALKEKYRAEREKRLRDDGFDQYVGLAGSFDDMLDDPYVEPGFDREPVTDKVDVLIVGGGFGGLLAGARLREAGVKDIRIIEKAGDFGGTWYWNRYPGAACDVESYVYLPLLEELGHMPSRKYAPGPEIFEHCKEIGHHFDLYPCALFQTSVTDMRWNEKDRRWIVRTDRDDAVRARFVIMANGGLNLPKLPRIPGIETYAGHSFHTSRWDYDYTGGTSEGGLDKLGDKTVGIIGTGATAVQVIPHLGASAKQLYVFQRTPSSIDIRADRSTDPDWFASLQPGWQQQRVENFAKLTSGDLSEEDLVKDGWTEVANNARELSDKMLPDDPTAEQIAEVTQLVDFRKMEQLRNRIDETVKDPAVAAALKPYYNHFCKRPCFHDEYLPTFNRPNVTLVDTDGKGVEQITPEGVIAGGKEYPLDCLVYATGFEVGTDFDRRLGYPIYGVDGRELQEKWSAGVSTLHGFTTNGFPNCFLVSHTQSGFGINFVHLLDKQATHLAYILGRASRGSIQRIEATEEAEQAWVDQVLEFAVKRKDFLEECTPGYYNYEGKLNRMSALKSPYGGGALAFVEILEAWRAEGNMAGLAVERQEARSTAAE